MLVALWMAMSVRQSGDGLLPRGLILTTLVIQPLTLAPPCDFFGFKLNVSAAIGCH